MCIRDRYYCMRNIPVLLCNKTALCVCVCFQEGARVYFTIKFILHPPPHDKSLAFPALSVDSTVSTDCVLNLSEFHQLHLLLLHAKSNFLIRQFKGIEQSELTGSKII